MLSEACGERVEGLEIQILSLLRSRHITLQLLNYNCTPSSKIQEYNILQKIVFIDLQILDLFKTTIQISMMVNNDVWVYCYFKNIQLLIAQIISINIFLKTSRSRLEIVRTDNESRLPFLFHCLNRKRRESEGRLVVVRPRLAINPAKSEVIIYCLSRKYFLRFKTKSACISNQSL